MAWAAPAKKARAQGAEVLKSMGSLTKARWPDVQDDPFGGVGMRLLILSSCLLLGEPRV